MIDALAHLALTPAEHTVDVEWRAFESGVKPAIRVSASPADAASIVARYQRTGVSVVQSEPIVLRGSPSVISYVARSPEAAEEMRDTERRLLEGPSTRERRLTTVELGRMLGYPACCASAFARRNHGGVRGAITALLARKWGHDAYLGARDARVARPEPRLNPLLMRERRSLISFDPCRYDCSHALALANRIVAVLETSEPDWVETVQRELSRPIVVATNGARAHVELDRSAAHFWIRAAEAPRDFRGREREIDRLLATALVGRVIGRRGLIRGSRAFAPPVLVDFSAGREPHAACLA